MHVMYVRMRVCIVKSFCPYEGTVNFQRRVHVSERQRDREREREREREGGGGGGGAVFFAVCEGSVHFQRGLLIFSGKPRGKPSSPDEKKQNKNKT